VADRDRPCELANNENPAGPSTRVLAAIADELPNLHRYPDATDAVLRTALAARFGRGLTVDHFFAGASGSDVLELVARALLEPDDEVIVCPPTFPVYATTARRERARVVEVRLEPGTFAHDVEAIARAVTPRTRLVYICNPGNPTGVAMPAVAFSALLDALPPEAVVVADEVYAHYVTSSEFPDSIGAVLAARPIVIVHSFSKVYGLAGLRLGYGVAPPALVARIARFHRRYHLGRLELVAGVAALADEAYVRASVERALTGRRQLCEGFERLGVVFWPSQANFVLMRPAVDAEEVCRKLADRGVRVRSTAANGLPGHVRVSIGLPAENTRLLEALDEVLSCA
jgi:histidinol-phosphate aminotransferase